MLHSHLKLQDKKEWLKPLLQGVFRWSLNVGLNRSELIIEQVKFWLFEIKFNIKDSVD